MAPPVTPLSLTTGPGVSIGHRLDPKLGSRRTEISDTKISGVK